MEGIGVRWGDLWLAVTLIWEGGQISGGARGKNT